MAKKGLPRLSESVRFYVEDTLRIRPRSPGIEHYPPRRRSGRGAVVAAVAAAVLLALAFRCLAP